MFVIFIRYVVTHIILGGGSFHQIAIAISLRPAHNPTRKLPLYPGFRGDQLAPPVPRPGAALSPSAPEGGRNLAHDCAHGDGHFCALTQPISESSADVFLVTIGLTQQLTPLSEISFSSQPGSKRFLASILTSKINPNI